MALFIEGGSNLARSLLILLLASRVLSPQLNLPTSEPVIAKPSTFGFYRVKDIT